ncbi:phage antirepressor KilAC domain-containing protein [Listeria monocytogenes]|uniref:Phage antirepressor Ant n=1 Tax=Listeria monocytogenes TaxID=1639 RepID=A0A9P1XN45_LISMN|nr:phage antirepressor KilAC domain-containing protein [Listeria monocytogenes]ASH85335.1 AntA/AntB antirepressor domain protein [Listeria monocytogenes serotype 1/2a str. 01-1468]EAC2321217.1 phage antirepressor Ant [Listeria monocytogenes]EAC3860285.1 phage antirepressor Ant [Listeria monocytogenes]EAC5420101.1 phage antirepressor Ant [Listeria monocytogenes]EAC5446976.1 phage antirepressor Ant [Listeria monocytogenes]
MQELVATHQNENGDLIVSARELHEFLGVKTKYKDWFPRMVEYGFVENTDFTLAAQKRATKNPKNPYTEIIDHHIKLPMAKEISMIQRSEKGKQARRYFLAVESAWNSPEMIMSRALEIANQQQQQMFSQLAELEPKAQYYDLVLQSPTLIKVTEIAKDYGFSARHLNSLLSDQGIQYNLSGTWFLRQQYADKGYTHSKTFTRSDGGTNSHTYWTQTGRLFIYETLKAMGIYPLLERQNIEQGSEVSYIESKA